MESKPEVVPSGLMYGLPFSVTNINSCGELFLSWTILFTHERSPGVQRYSVSLPDVDAVLRGITLVTISMRLENLRFNEFAFGGPR